jgi:hypothetical protein
MYSSRGKSSLYIRREEDDGGRSLRESAVEMTSGRIRVGGLYVEVYTWRSTRAHGHPHIVTINMSEEQS